MGCVGTKSDAVICPASMSSAIAAGQYGSSRTGSISALRAWFALGYSAERSVSGAGHDSLHTATFAPTTLIFVPCEGGLSHNEAEAADPADLAAGANTLLHAVLMVADNQQGKAIE